jgi:hypothetical protein
MMVDCVLPTTIDISVVLRSYIDIFKEGLITIFAVQKEKTAM